MSIQIGDFPNLVTVELGGTFGARNALTGTIPPALSKLQKLERLDLSRNRLTGTIPPELADLPSLTRLDLYNNLLKGCVPKCMFLCSSTIELFPCFITPVNFLQNTISDRTRCIAQLRPASSFLLSVLRFLDRMTEIMGPLIMATASLVVYYGLGFNGNHAHLTYMDARVGVTEERFLQGMGPSRFRGAYFTHWG